MKYGMACSVALCFLVSCRTSHRRTIQADEPTSLQPDQPRTEPPAKKDAHNPPVFIPDEKPPWTLDSMLPADAASPRPAPGTADHPVDFQVRFEYFPGTIPQYQPIVAGDGDGTSVYPNPYSARLYVNEAIRTSGAECTFSHGPVGANQESHALTIEANSAPGYYRYTIDDIKSNGAPTEALRRLADGTVSLSCTIGGKTYARSYRYQRFIHASTQAGAYALSLVRTPGAGVSGFEIKPVASFLKVKTEPGKPNGSLVLTGQADESLGANASVTCLTKRKNCQQTDWTYESRHSGVSPWTVEYALYEGMNQLRVMCTSSTSEAMRLDYSESFSFPGTIPCTP